MKRFAILFLLLGLAGCEWFQVPAGPPSVTSVVPASGAENVSPGAAVKAQLDLRSGDLNLTSVNSSSVTLTNVATGEAVPVTINTNNESERLTLRPTAELAFDTEYRFDITSSVEDEAGQAFSAYSSTFTTVPDGVPAVLAMRPADGETGVSVYETSAINADIGGLNGGVDPSSLEGNVYLTNLSTNERVVGTAATSGGNDTLTFTLDGDLETGTEYQLDVTSGVLDGAGTPFKAFTGTFVTDGPGTNNPPQPTGNVEIIEPGTSNEVRHSSLQVGPDGNLYATTIDGKVLRYPIANDGTLGTPQQLTALTEADGKARLTVGFAFDPTATADNLIAWVSSTSFTGFDGEGGIRKGNENWTGKITRLSGPNLSTQQDVVTGLPRSTKDHVTNSIAFNPAEPGVLYFNQGSNTAMGAPDTNWLFRAENVLAGAVLRLEYGAIGSGTLNAKTEEGGTYNPYAADAPLTIYASGTRNAYDLVWHSNGTLYVPANGSAAGGNMPRYNPLPGTCENRPDGGYSGTMLTDTGALPNYIATGPDGEPVDGWRINVTMHDYLLKVAKGGYYGSPNPKRCEWILYGGGSSTGVDKINGFPASVQADPNYQGYAYDFGQNVSPNGAIEYTGNTFSGLNGKLLVVRYQSGGDIVAISLDSSGNVSGEAQPVVGGNSFANPIDIAEDPRTGYLYVSAYDQFESATKPAGIYLLRPQ